MICRQSITWILVAILVLHLMACSGSRYRPDSPDVKYRQSQEYEPLQLPPDVAGTGEQQFVIPRASEKMSKGSLLPGADSATFKRDGSVSWLELNVAVEEFWPELLQFLEKEGLPLAKNDPATGLLLTEWKQPLDRVSRDGILQTVLGDKERIVEDQIQQYTLRVERVEGQLTRLFVKTRLYRKHKADDAAGTEKGWALIDDDPAMSADLLTKILVWIGLKEQQSKQLLSTVDIQEFHKSILLTSNKNNRHYILFWDNYENIFEQVHKASSLAGLEVYNEALDEGLIEVHSKQEFLSEIRQAQRQRELESAGFFSRLLGSGKDKDASLMLRLHRVESGVFALDVIEPDTGDIDSQVGRQVLESIRDALLLG